MTMIRSLANYHFSLVALLLSITTILSACGGGSGGTTTTQTPSATATITLNDNVTADDIITNVELALGNAVTIKGTVGGDVGNGDTVALTVNGNTFTGSVTDGSFSIDVSIVDLFSDSDSTVDASVTTSTGNLNGEATAVDTETYTAEQPITAFRLIDPSPGAGNQFGEHVAVLHNGNIVVTAPNDSSVMSNNGAVHLYNPVTQTRIASFFGDDVDDFLGSKGITALENSNFVIASPEDNVDGIIKSGSVMLIDGKTGELVGSAITGGYDGDQLGFNGIFAFANNNFAIASSFATNPALSDANSAGSVMLIDGMTGMQIGNTIAGDRFADRIGFNGITPLANNNFVINSELDAIGDIVRAGSVVLIDGLTAEQIGNTIEGNDTDDRVGSGGIAVLANNNFVISSPRDNRLSGITSNAGSVILVDGTTGGQIGDIFVGDDGGDQLSSSGIAVLTNNNFVVASPFDDVEGVTNAGSVMLISGTTGEQIGSTITGDDPIDLLGSTGITALGNNNFVISSNDYNLNGVRFVGSAMLINGATGEQIGGTIAGDDTLDQLGFQGITALENSNFVIATKRDDVGGLVDAGSVIIVDGETGDQIGNAFTGDNEGDQIGSNGIVVLENSNLAVVSENDNVDGVEQAGSVILIDSATGEQIGNTISGDNGFDQIGSSGVTTLSNNNLVVASSEDNSNNVARAGSVRLIDGLTSASLGEAIEGASEMDFDRVNIIAPDNLNVYLIAAPRADVDGADSGMVRLELIN